MQELLRRPEHLVKLILVEPHSRLQSSKFPHSVHFAVVMLVCSVRVALQLDSVQPRVRIDLMGRPQLVVADDERVRDFLPPCAAQQMLRFDGGIAQKVGVGNHLKILLSGHGIPFLQADLGVVNGEGRGNDALQTGPVLESLDQ